MKTTTSARLIGAVRSVTPKLLITQPSSYVPSVTVAGGLSANLRGATQISSEDYSAHSQANGYRAGRIELTQRIDQQFKPGHRSALALCAKFRPMGSLGEPPVLVPG